MPNQTQTSIIKLGSPTFSLLYLPHQYKRSTATTKYQLLLLTPTIILHRLTMYIISWILQTWISRYRDDNLNITIFSQNIALF